jgi:mutator protein MutT
MASHEVIVVTAAVVERDGAYLLTRRLEGTHLAGCWEFPGGKCQPGETFDEALRRELLEELGANAIVGGEILTTTHAYPERTVELHFFACELTTEPHPREGQQLQWIAQQELRDLDLPEADAELVDLLTR